MVFPFRMKKSDPDDAPIRKFGEKGRARTSSSKIIPQGAAAARVAQLPQRLGFNLAYPFSRDAQPLAHFLQCMVLSVE
jgi:hypothetical protein